MVTDKKPIPLTDESFDEFVNKYKTSVIDCWASWCLPCRMLSPIIDQLAEEYDEIAFGKLNVDENPKIPLRFGIMAIPTLLYFKNGELISKESGALPKNALEKRLEKLLS
ncbi:MAG: thioredoxin [Candidatus Bathyarchaeia archaeon]